jgi:hypothetical protein
MTPTPDVVDNDDDYYVILLQPKSLKMRQQQGQPLPGAWTSPARYQRGAIAVACLLEIL